MLHKLIFNGKIFETNSNMTLSSADNDNSNEIEINQYNYNGVNGSEIIESYSRGKNIKIKGKLKAGTLGELNSLIRGLKYTIGQGLQDLYVFEKYGSANTEITLYSKAICTNPNTFIIREGNYVTFCFFEINFLIPEGFLEDSGYTSLSSTLGTNIGLNPTYIGTSDYEPNILITLNSIGNINKIQFNIKDLSIFIEDLTFANGDEIYIDCKTQNVYKNNNRVDYSGFFPVLNRSEDVLVNFLNGTSNASGYNVTYNFKYKNRYS